MVLYVETPLRLIWFTTYLILDDGDDIYVDTSSVEYGIISTTSVHQRVLVSSANQYRTVPSTL